MQVSAFQILFILWSVFSIHHFAVEENNELFPFRVGQLLETTLMVRCRRQDQPLVEKAIPLALADYKAISGRSCKMEIDTNSYLPAEMWV